MDSFDVRVFAIRRRPGRKTFEVRWRVAGRDRSRSFMTRALADSYRAELVRAARSGTGFDPATGEPAAGRGRAGDGDLVPARGGVCAGEMAAPDTALAGQPGRRPGHSHPAADQGDRPQATTREGARRPVRACLQPPAAAVLRAGPGHRQLAGLAGTRIAAGQPAQRSGHHPGCPGRAVRAGGRLARRGKHGQPQAGGVPRRPGLCRRARAAARQPAEPGALARAQGRRGRQACRRGQPGAGPGDPGRDLPGQAGAGGVLRLPVLCGAAPGRSRGPAPR